MGREIRRVPPNWKHPTKIECGFANTKYNDCFQPMYDINYEVAALQWLKDCILWSEGKHPDQTDSCKYYWEYEDPPDEITCRPYKDEDATWYQVYETVTEGTPTTPSFETEEELINHLVNIGENYFSGKPISREAAEQFVLKDKFCFSMILDHGDLKIGIESVIKLDNVEG